MEPLVSILIPAFNAEPWLGDAIRSAITQTWPRKEIVVVNDGSTDRTLDVARQFERSGVRVASQANQGAAAARNHALSLSHGDYIQWLDADDILDSTKIARQMAVLADRGSPMTLASCAWGTFLSRRHRARFVPTSLWCDLSPVDWLLRKMNDGVFMQTAAWLVSRPLTEAAGPWDTRLLTDDDGEYFCRVLLRSDGVRHVPDAKVYYRATGPGRLSYVGRDQRKVEMMFLSIELHINYVLAVENTERVRAACVRYLQNHLVNFYPGQPDILARAQRLAGLLGGKLEGPSFEPKYAWIDRVAGPHVAKSAQLFFPRARWAVARPWDEALSRIDRPDTHSTSTEAYFGVGDRPDELPVAAVRGGAQVVLAQVFSTVVRVVSSVVLAHLLMPADFGMVAMVIGVTAGLMIFKDLGLCDAIIQWPKLTHVQVSSLFWVNVGVSLTIALGLMAVSPLIAHFYREPRLIGIAILWSTTLVLGGLSAQHFALLKRGMFFAGVSRLSMLAAVIANAGAILLASRGAGYWSLVLREVFNEATMALGAWLVCSWRPGLPSRRSGIGPMLVFGGQSIFSFVVRRSARNLDRTLLGWRFGAVTAGYYHTVFELAATSTVGLAEPLRNVAVSALSKLRDDATTYRRYYLKALAGLALPCFAATGGLVAMSDDLVALVLGAKWESSGALLSILGLSAGVSVIYLTNVWLHFSLGRADRLARWTIVESIVVAVAVSLGLRFGAKGVAWGYTSAMYVLCVSGLAYAGRPVGLGAIDVIRALWRAAFAAAAAAVPASYAAHLAVFHQPAARIGVFAIVFLPIFGGLALVLHGGPQRIKEALANLRNCLPGASISRDRSNPDLNA